MVGVTRCIPASTQCFKACTLLWLVNTVRCTISVPTLTSIGHDINYIALSGILSVSLALGSAGSVLTVFADASRNH
jgi:hypothetical protein